MLRTVLSVVLGYLALFLFVMISFSLLWIGIGQEGAFVPGTTRVTPLWLAFSLPLSFFAAVLGGMVTAWIGRERARVGLAALTAFVLAFGIATALGQSTASPDQTAVAPPGELSVAEAAGQARQPTWVAWFLPFLGAGGVLVGGGIVIARAPSRDEVVPEREPIPGG